MSEPRWFGQLSLGRDPQFDGFEDNDWCDEHGGPASACEQCIDEQGVADDQAEDEDWRDD